MAVQTKQLKIHLDAKGFVFEPLEPESLSMQHNVHIAICKPGVVRGNHYHMNGTETIAVAGPALACIKENNKIYDIMVPAKKVYQFIIPPNVSHAFKNIGDESNILVGFNTVLHDSQSPDVGTDILISR